MSCLLSCVPSVSRSPDSPRQPSLFGGPVTDQGSAHMSENAPMSLAPIRLQTMRVWLRNSQLNPMNEIKERGLGELVFEAIVLEHPRRQPVHYSDRPQGAILVDLAVLGDGLQRVLEVYGPVDFIPLGNKDPIILAQEPDDIASKKALAYQKLYAIYLHEYEKRRGGAAVLGYELHEDTTAWFEERLRAIGGRLRRLGYY